MITLKKFCDLDFKQHPNFKNGKQALLYFPNGYGISVFRLKSDFDGSYISYTSNDDEWEVAVMRNGSLCYSTHITDDVIGYCTDEKVTEIMAKIQEL